MNNHYFSTFGGYGVTHKGVQSKDISGSKSWNSLYSGADYNYKVTIISNALAGRADLISFYSYGTVDYWWLICLVNEIDDPLQGLPSGKQIKIPII